VICIQFFTNQNNTNGLSIDVDADRSVSVFENGDALWIELKNGEMFKGVVTSKESAYALFCLLGVKLGYIENLA
jgi:hypothetical protein